MKHITILVLLFLSIFCLQAGEAPEHSIEQEITTKQADRSTAEKQLQERLGTEQLSAEGEKAREELDKELGKPESQRNEQTINDLLAKIASDPQATDQVKTDVKTINGINADIATLQKEAAEVQSLFTGAGGQPKLSFFDRVSLKFQEWGKRLKLNWGFGDAITLRGELADIYAKLGDPLAQVQQKQSLAQEMPATTERINADIESLNLLAETKKTAQAADIQKTIEKIIVDLIDLKNKIPLTDEEGKAIAQQIDAALKKLNFTPQELSTLLQKPTGEEAYARKFITTFFDVPYMYDSFKSQRDSVLADIRKDPIKALQSKKYEDFLTSFNQLVFTDLEQLKPEQQANVASLVRSTYQMLADNFKNQALKLGLLENLDPERINIMLNLFTKSNNAFEQAQAWDIHLHNALENEKKEIENSADYQKLVQENNGARSITPVIEAIPQTVAPKIATVEKSIDDPTKTQATFDSILLNIDKAIEAIDNADPSVTAVNVAAQLGQQATGLYNAIDQNTQEKTLSNAILTEDAKRLIALEDRREQLSAVENENMQALVQPVGNSIAQLPQIEKKNISFTPPQTLTPSRQALLNSINAGDFNLKKVVQDQQRSPQQQDSLQENLVKALAARRNAIEHEEEEEGGGGEWIP